MTLIRLENYVRSVGERELKLFRKAYILLLEAEPIFLSVLPVVLVQNWPGMTSIRVPLLK